MLYRNFFHSIWTRLIDFLIPPSCLNCKSLVLDDTALCGDCWSKIRFISAPFCEICGRALEYDAEACGNCASELCNVDFDHARSIFVYDENSSGLILKFKHGDQLHFGVLFANLIKNMLHSYVMQSDLIIPVPIHWTRLLKRRYNQSAILAMYLSKASGIPFDTSSLIRTRATKPQHASIAERIANVKNAFAISEKHVGNIVGRNILLLDDVFTTGSTVTECARTLKQFGAKSVNVVTVARVQ